MSILEESKSAWGGFVNMLNLYALIRCIWGFKLALLEAQLWSETCVAAGLNCPVMVLHLRDHG